MLIAGIGGHLKDALVDILSQYKTNEIVFYTDFENDINIVFYRKLGLTVLVGLEAAQKYFIEVDKRFVVFIGDNRKRESQVLSLEKIGGIPSAYLSKNTMANDSLSEFSNRNSIIMHYVHIAAGSSLLEGAVAYNNCAIGHNVVIGRFAFVGAFCVLGDAHIGDYTFLGLHSVIGPGVTIGKNCIIGANSYVKTDMPDNSLVVGTPARVIRKL